MKSNVLVVIYSHSQVRSFIETKSFKKIAQQKKYNLEFLYSKKLIKYLPTEQLEENQFYSWNESIINWEIKTKE